MKDMNTYKTMNLEKIRHSNSYLPYMIDGLFSYGQKPKSQCLQIDFIDRCPPPPPPQIMIGGTFLFGGGWGRRNGRTIVTI